MASDHTRPSGPKDNLTSSNTVAPGLFSNHTRPSGSSNTVAPGLFSNHTDLLGEPLPKDNPSPSHAGTSGSLFGKDNMELIPTGNPASSHAGASGSLIGKDNMELIPTGNPASSHAGASGSLVDKDNMELIPTGNPASSHAGASGKSVPQTNLDIVQEVLREVSKGSEPLVILGFESEHVSPKELKRAIKRRALQTHPDKNGGSKDAEKAFLAVREAASKFGVVQELWERWHDEIDIIGDIDSDYDDDNFELSAFTRDDNNKEDDKEDDKEFSPPPDFLGDHDIPDPFQIDIYNNMTENVQKLLEKNDRKALREIAQANSQIKDMDPEHGETRVIRVTEAIKHLKRIRRIAKDIKENPSGLQEKELEREIQEYNDWINLWVETNHYPPSWKFHVKKDHSGAIELFSDTTLKVSTSQDSPMLSPEVNEYLHTITDHIKKFFRFERADPRAVNHNEKIKEMNRNTGSPEDAGLIHYEEFEHIRNLVAKALAVVQSSADNEESGKLKRNRLGSAMDYFNRRMSELVKIYHYPESWICEFSFAENDRIRLVFPDEKVAEEEEKNQQANPRDPNCFYTRQGLKIFAYKDVGSRRYFVVERKPSSIVCKHMDVEEVGFSEASRYLNSSAPENCSTKRPTYCRRDVIDGKPLSSVKMTVSKIASTSFELKPNGHLHPLDVEIELRGKEPRDFKRYWITRSDLRKVKGRAEADRIIDDKLMRDGIKPPIKPKAPRTSNKNVNDLGALVRKLTLEALQEALPVIQSHVNARSS